MTATSTTDTTSSAVLAAARDIAERVSVPLAATWDGENRFPAELFAALHEAGLDAMSVPRRLGGLEIGPDTADPLTMWLVLRTLATADSASTHCVQVHSNTVHAVRLLGTPEQHDRYLGPVASDGAVFGFWGSEQDGRPEAHGRGFTTAKRVAGGWELTGKKYYSTNARAARFAVVFAFPEGATDPLGEMMLCIVDCTSDGVIVNPSWWDSATGMRATVSDEVLLEDVFIPDDAVLGSAGAYWQQQVQARYLPAFSSNFQGVGSHLLTYGMDYVRSRGRHENPTLRRYLGEARLHLVNADLLLRHTADLYASGNLPQAFHHSRMLRSYSELATRRVLELVQASCGASIYFREHPLERMLRDWNFFSRHENIDLILEAVGTHEFGLGGGGSPEDFGFGNDHFRPGP